ncbi:putative membrane protein [Methylobacterium sp. PvP062]|jgi:uncharacterized membrane protein|uniref:Membrane protein n=2 Tax=Methylobacterium TaxID=407 RepID=A0ABV2NCD3_9HYPH|nr:MULTISPECIES: DUF2231 domain-containing protein [Methylobacterium]MCX7333535.1 DUF2231 domain-containing protein [Hyphomicrobiales bacterium]AYO83214.1 DUF2231 domain-containing protein [Methylobacterium brachiatum]MBP2492605.1 putative membrane protein [Methylobacterium sp. PvP105]MBP2501023.1 putative membrane protein [Methylobacterium sp. PvP109]MDQ0440553.1 putative membrane protein [Methylobacterium persicinum]
MIEVIPNWHPVAVHFTVALLITASVLFAAGTLFRTAPLGDALTTAARWNLAIGIAVTVATLATGWSAYNTVAHDAASHENMTVHLRWAVATALIFLVAGGVAWSERRKGAGAGIVLLALLAGGSGTLAVTGWLGGENVYRYGLGVMALPKSGDHVHPGGGGPPHEHGRDHVHEHDHAPVNGPATPDAAAGKSGMSPAPDAAAHDHAHGQEHGHEQGQGQVQVPAGGPATPEAAGKAGTAPAPDAAAPHDHTH